VIRSLIITCALLVICCCPTSRAGEPKTVLEQKLRTIILPRVYMLDMPLADAIQHLRDASVAYDPERQGINILYLPPRPNPPGDQQPTGPTITMQYKDIPLGDLLFELRAVSSIRLGLEIDNHAVRFYDPASYTPPMSLRVYAVPDVLFDPGSTRSNPMGEPPDPVEDVDIQTRFEDLGVYFQPTGRLTYNLATKRLIVYDTAHTHRMIGRILHEYIRQPAQVQMNVTLIEVTDTAPLQAEAGTPLTYAALMAIPPERRRVIYRESSIVDAGQDQGISDRQPATLYGQAGQLEHRSVFSTTLGDDRYTIETQLRWSIGHRTTTVPTETLMRAALQTTVVQWDGHPQLLAVHTQRHEDAQYQLFLVLLPVVVDPDGHPRRSLQID